jgi:hypothetical protein
MTNEIRSLIADDGFAMSFQSMGQYRTALLRELAGGNPHSRTDDEILRFLDNHELIDGHLEQNVDGTLRWVYTERLNRYDGDDDWDVKGATDTLLSLVRWIKEPSFLGPIPEPVSFRFYSTHHHSVIYIEACDRGNTKWVVRDRNYYLNKQGEWELPNSLSYPEFLDKFSWPTKEDALAAYRAIPKPPTLEQRQAAEIAELRALLNQQQSTTDHQP